MNYYFNASPNGAATVGAYSVLDLGAAANGGSDLRLDVIAFTDNDVEYVCPVSSLSLLTRLQYHELRATCERSRLSA